MTARARVDAMKPSRPGRTRTADASPPPNFWRRGNYLPYLAFGSCGLLLLLVAFGILRLVWTLGDGDPAAWNAIFESYGHPLFLVFHAFALVALTWFTFRFFRLFPKTQPPKIGPFKRPPDVVFLLGLAGAFTVATTLAALVLGGALP
jgi:fumarate reductase subunit C